MSLFPFDASAVGHEVDKLFYLALKLTGFTFLLVVAVLLYFAIRYRSRKGGRGYYTHGNSPKALGLTLFLALIVFVGIDINLAVHDHFAWEKTWGRAPRGNALRVEIQPQQFAWNIRYAGPDEEFKTEDDIVTMNQMHVPINRPVIVALQSKDVIHSFFLPNFRLKQDAVPGMVTSLSFLPTKEGAYDIACAEHCGLGHYRMRGLLTVESEEKFNQWLISQRQGRAADLAWGWKWGGTA